MFGFAEIARWTNDCGEIQNAEMTVGDTELWLDGSGPEGRPKPAWIGVWVDDVDTMGAQVRAAT